MYKLIYTSIHKKSSTNRDANINTNTDTQKDTDVNTNTDTIIYTGAKIASYN